MPQSWNPAAIRVAARVLFRQPALAVPHLEVRDVGCLDFAALRAAGCEAVVFDKDNTLTAPYAAEVHPRAAAAVRRCVDAFGASRTAVLSNSAGTPDDPGYRQADALERSLGLPVLRRREKKLKGCQLKAVQVRASGHGTSTTAARLARNGAVEGNRQSAAQLRHEHVRHMLQRAEQQEAVHRTTASRAMSERRAREARLSARSRRDPRFDRGRVKVG